MKMTITKNFTFILNDCKNELELTFKSFSHRAEFSDTPLDFDIIEKMMESLIEDSLDNSMVYLLDEWIEWSHNWATPFQNNYGIKIPTVENMLYFIWAWVVDNTPVWFYSSLVELRLYRGSDDYVELKTNTSL